MTADGGVTAHTDDISGATLDNEIVTDLEVLDLVRTAGSLTIVRGPALRLRRSGWAAEFGALARDHGVHTSVRDDGRLVLILDLGWTGWAPPSDTTDDRDSSTRPV